MNHIIGIDEAGRGPLAGPVAVGVVRMSERSQNLLEGIRDSKKLSESNREKWYKWAIQARRKERLYFFVSLVSEKTIDKKGINFAIDLGLKRCLKAVNAQTKDCVLLDGGLSVPDKFKYQGSIIKGDEKISVISLASILAKVTRDRKMVKYAKDFPKFSFERHKGYGTKLHMENIRKYGSTKLHRKTYIKHLTRGGKM